MPSTSKQAYTYTTIKDVIITKIQQKFGYKIAVSLRELQLYNMENDRPTQIISNATDPTDKTQEQIGFDMLYQAEILYFFKQKKHSHQTLRKRIL